MLISLNRTYEELKLSLKRCRADGVEEGLNRTYEELKHIWVYARRLRRYGFESYL